MHLKEAIRNLSFWTFDFFKGSPVKRHYNEVKFILNDPSNPAVIELKKKRLEDLLSFATKNTKFYKNINASSIEEFPVISKNEVVENFADFESKPYLKMERFLATTSGSTGYPFKLWLDKNKKDRNTADTLFFSELVNYKIGRNLVYLKLWEKKNYKSPLTLFKENILKHDVMDYTPDDLNKLLDQMGKNGAPKIILAYSSFLEYLCNYMQDSNISMERANVRSIISIAEALNVRAKECLTERFNTAVFSRYSNQENGILAQQTSASPNLYISNTASYYIEFLHPDKDEPAPLGSWGRVVVTDLFNYAMPIIRYDTGDLAIAEEFDVHSGYKFSEILGRKFDMIFDTKGDLVIPHTFLHIENYSDCKQFQFIQDGAKEYRFKINGANGSTDEAGASQYFKDLLGEDAIISYQYVNENLQLSSGKHQKVVSNYKKNK